MTTTATLEYTRSMKSREEINNLHKVFSRQRDLKASYKGLNGRKFVFVFATRQKAVEFLQEMEKSFYKHGERTVRVGNW